MNAKRELLKIVNKNNLEILKIDCYFDYVSDEINEITLTTLDELDREYDNGFGLQHLYGIVYCRNKINYNPVWLTRLEYDGAEAWHINTIPDFYLDKITINE